VTDVNDLPHPFQVQMISLSAFGGEICDEMAGLAERGIISCIIGPSGDLKVGIWSEPAGLRAVSEVIFVVWVISDFSSPVVLGLMRD